MGKCERCNIFSKIICCCSEHPETLETVDFEINGEKIKACPHLGKDGKCLIYSSRPEICRDFSMCSILEPAKKK